MMSTNLSPKHLIHSLPGVRGELKADETLSRYT